ncbi:MAG: hypothetical protein V4519_02520 [Patescibacteria group bacterium]
MSQEHQNLMAMTVGLAFMAFLLVLAAIATRAMLKPAEETESKASQPSTLMMRMRPAISKMMKALYGTFFVFTALHVFIPWIVGQYDYQWEMFIRTSGHYGLMLGFLTLGTFLGGFPRGDDMKIVSLVGKMMLVAGLVVPLTLLTSVIGTQVILTSVQVRVLVIGAVAILFFTVLALCARRSMEKA